MVTFVDYLQKKYKDVDVITLYELHEKAKKLKSSKNFGEQRLSSYYFDAIDLILKFKDFCYKHKFNTLVRVIHG